MAECLGSTRLMFEVKSCPYLAELEMAQSAHEPRLSLCLFGSTRLKFNFLRAQALVFDFLHYMSYSHAYYYLYYSYFQERSHLS